MRHAMMVLISLLGLLFTGSVIAIGWLLVQARDRRLLLRQLATPVGGGGASPSAVPAIGVLHRLLRPLLTHLAPKATQPATATPPHKRLAGAGFHEPGAPRLLRLFQFTLMGGGIVLALVLTAQLAPAVTLAATTAAASSGLFLPLALLDRLAARRRERISHGIPDALDLLVVCVEAGVGLDAAMQRVSGELAVAHPELSDELTDMSRRLAAGVPRDLAFQSLYGRTGVEELRSLASHLIQSERWGTSIANVLRTYSRELRRRRRRTAEQRAATAATRMLAPMALCIFPTIFIVILGPAVVRIAATFREMAR